MIWKKIKLGDIAEFSNGINFGKEAYAAGIKLVGVSNFGDNFFPNYDELEEVKNDVVRANDLLEDGDIVFVRSNGNKELVGRCMLIKDAPTDVTYSGFCIRTRFKSAEEHDPVFWTYHFKNQSFRKAMSGTAVGANIQNLSQGRLAVYEAEVPDIVTQRKIASILLKYDGLIENNKKQISLLEEAAQRLYKKWFLEYRFPEHNSFEIDACIPEGWNVISIDKVYEIKYGKTLPTSKVSENGKYPVYGANGVIGYYGEKNVDEIVPLITSRGNGSGDVFRTHHKEAFITNNSFVVKGKYEYLKMPFIYEHMLHLDFKGICTGSAQPQLTNNSISTLNVVLPKSDLISKYNDIVGKWFEKIEVLNVQNKKASEARDRLLPKLMSGEIEV